MQRLQLLDRPISDDLTYLKNLSTSLLDKLYWTRHLNAADLSTIVDIGCADGLLLEAIANLNPQATLWAIDQNPQMLSHAARRLHRYANPIHYGSTASSVPVVPPNSALILSSVLHEIGSYSSGQEQAAFWQWVQRTGFKYIIIRDMVDSCELSNVPGWTARRIAATLAQPSLKLLATKWTAERPLPQTSQELAHFLLKEPYLNTGSCARELAENYFAYHKKTIISQFQTHQWSIIHQKHFSHPWLQKRWKTLHGIRFSAPTHLELIVQANPAV